MYESTQEHCRLVRYHLLSSCMVVFQHARQVLHSNFRTGDTIANFRFGTGDKEDGKPSENIDLRMRETEHVSVLLSLGTVPVVG